MPQALKASSIFCPLVAALATVSSRNANQTNALVVISAAVDEAGPKLVSFVEKCEGFGIVFETEARSAERRRRK